MSQMNHGNHDREERYSTLMNNAGAIRAICSAVEGTLGPKGLDTMLVGADGEVIITNDGVTILEKMDVSHPAARLLIQVARSQQNEVGDGTTTATVLAGALVNEGVAQVTRGVPVAKVVAGLQHGIRSAVDSLRAKSVPMNGLEDQLLYRIAVIAGREQADIADLIIEGAKRIGTQKLMDDRFCFSDTVALHETPGNEVFPGIIIRKQPMNVQSDVEVYDAAVMVVQDALEPDTIDEEALSTEAGFQRYMELKKQFLLNLEKLVSLQVGLIVVDRGIDREAEQFCADRGIAVLQRATQTDLKRICEYTGAKPVKRSALKKTVDELTSFLGFAEQVSYNKKLGQTRIAGGSGESTVTLLVGASTREVTGERARIAKDAAAAVQAAVRGGCLPGGGAVEIAVARELEQLRHTMKGMEGFGMEAVVQSLLKPLSQIVLNAGFNPLEKVEEVKAAQIARGSDRLGIHCDTGELMDCMEQGIVDPALVKINALQAAGEVAAAVLRIHTVVKMKQNDTESY